ncbi:hypothetical protein SAMN04488077_10737 [Roseovarius tolerans]|uniref:Uncharacterized protein n=1 Tax=Roseovarius tolerans TaxID=74031 RepID=A0A1H8AJW1_9RHOB|nr:hypothetical protein [Roseovarius tolerans]SEM69817.1 hypothetical protein SAMN04488077_10737 [Roseovarius tolerans]
MTFNLALEEIAQNAYTSAHFGGNILATGDRLGADGTFDETAEALNIEFLRYPGGALIGASADARSGDQRVDHRAHTVSRGGRAVSVVIPDEWRRDRP